MNLERIILSVRFWPSDVLQKMVCHHAYCCNLKFCGFVLYKSTWYGFSDCSDCSLFLITQVLVEYRNKDLNHVEWAKALKELYLPGLRDYVKSFYPLGPLWSFCSKAIVSAAPKSPAPAAPATPPPPPAPFFSDLNLPLQNQRLGCLSFFPSKSFYYSVNFFVTILFSFLVPRKVTDDMKAKNRADRSGVVPVCVWDDIFFSIAD